VSIRALTPADGSVCEVMVKELPPLHDQKRVVLIRSVCFRSKLSADEPRAGQLLSVGSDTWGVDTCRHMTAVNCANMVSWNH
jgi:hypothetical protein